MEDKNLKSIRNEQEHHISTHQSVIEINQNTTNLITPRPLSFLLSFTNLTYTVNLRSKFKLPTKISLPIGPQNPATKTILKSVSGEARDGEILALLGASGSGKSTLIDALANRIARESLRGEISLNGEATEKSSKLSKAITAYVMQDDLLFPMLTVEETLTFAAEFRLPRELSGDKKRERVQALIDQLGLRGVEKTIIGDEDHRGVSGGERRRVSIGVDIIHDPILLFLDEPTSGLDSTSAFTVVKVLKRIAMSGSVVVMSVHQPSYRIVEFLDRLMFLSRGEVVFVGSPGKLPLFFSDFGRRIPDTASHVEFALDVIFELENSTDGIGGLVEFNKAWPGREMFADYGRTLNEGLRGERISDFRKTVTDFANPFWVETFLLLKRCGINSRRMPMHFITQFVTILVTASMLASIYHKTLSYSERGIRKRLGLFAFALITPYFFMCRNIPLLLQQQFIIFKETAYNTYRTFSYVLAHCLYDVPSIFVLSFAFSSVTFWVIGLDGGLSGFAFFLWTIFASFWAANSFITLVSSVVRDTLVAFTTVLSISSYFLLFSGFFVSKGEIPRYWIWLHYISTIKYSYEASARSEFEGLAHEKCYAWAEKPGSSTCLMSGTDVLRNEDITDLGKWECLLVVVAWGFFFWILFYFSLALGNKNKRK